MVRLKATTRFKAMSYFEEVVNEAMKAHRSLKKKKNATKPYMLYIGVCNR